MASLLRRAEAEESFSGELIEFVVKLRQVTKPFLIPLDCRQPGSVFPDGEGIAPTGGREPKPGAAGPSNAEVMWENCPD